MQKYIEQLKEKPEPIRKQIALVGAIVGSGIVAIFWVTTLSFDTTAAARETKETIIQPLAAIKNNAVSTYEEMRNERPVQIIPENETPTDENIETGTAVDESSPETIENDQPIY